jgi:hypothetical protein
MNILMMCADRTVMMMEAVIASDYVGAMVRGVDTYIPLGIRQLVDQLEREGVQQDEFFLGGGAAPCLLPSCTTPMPRPECSLHPRPSFTQLPRLISSRRWLLN